MMKSPRQGMPPDAINIHSTVIVLGDRGLALTGAPGAGKTSLALALIRQFRSTGRFARLVGDDQVFVAVRAGRLVAYAPVTIAGLAEVRGFGPVAHVNEAACVVDLVIELIARNDTQRQWRGVTIEIAGAVVPLVRRARRSLAENIVAIEEIVASVLRPNDQVSANRLDRSDLGLPSFFSQTT